jgi:phosphoenolpyruvate carboxykinase (GTP)
MFQKKKGIDIAVDIGGITTFEAAMRLFEKRLDEKNLSRIKEIKHSEIVVKIANSIAMCDPELFLSILDLSRTKRLSGRWR